MKKMMSLVLVLALCLTAVAAYAAAPSKVVGTIGTTTASITIIPPTDEETKAAIAELEKLIAQTATEYFGIVGTAITEVDEFGPINAEVGKDAVIDAEGNVDVTFSVDFPFGIYENVKVLLGDGTAWKAFDGAASGNLVTAKVNAEVLTNAKFFAIGK